MLERVDQIFLTVAHAITGLIGPEWLRVIIAMLLPAVVCVLVWPLFFAFLTWLERKVLARIQNRYGPNRVGPFGLLQPIADGMKMLTKEDIVPRAADKLLHGLAPVMIAIPAFAVFALLPFGRNMTPADVDVSVLLFFAISSISTLALFFAGWGSRNKYSLLGAMRAIAQMISYELPLVITAVPPIMIAASMNLTDIVDKQGPGVMHWFIWKPWGFVGFAAFVVAGMAELNRSPFDIAEGESEIIAGFHTEYSGFKFALFFLAEYLSTIAFSGLAAALYLGGWNGPAFLPSWLWFFLKILGLIALMMWARGTFPRLRVDQLMGFSWKFLMPLGLANIFVCGLWYKLTGPAWSDKLVAWGVAFALIVPVYLLLARLNATPSPSQRVYRYADL